MKKVLSRLIPHLKKLLIQLEKFTTTKKTLPSDSINSLAPKIITDESELKKIEPYLASLKNALDSDFVNNIAVTGSYGSGKSTILKTFQFHHTEYEYLNISLASFQDNKEDKDDFERKLEVSILQQMFYHVKPSKIPDSRFKRIVNLKKGKLLAQTFFFLIWLTSIIILFKFDYINKLNPKGWSLKFSFDWGSFLLIILFLAGVGLYVKSIIRLFSNSKISKFNIKGEVELNEATDKSVFNQHLEEILYFFERTGFNVVIIEDVDRFGSTDIFTKLREINILVNNSKLIKRKIKFVYAIKDEMFKISTERVKFFELIIPVIPFINPSNASDQLTKMIKEAGLQNTLPTDFTDDVVTFIDDIDMRLLINIFHEYRIYSTVLSTELSQSNLFSLVVYKNMYPEDFGELSKRKGKLYKFLSGRSDYASGLKKELNKKKSQIEQSITGIEAETQTDIKELRAIYINHLISKLENFKSFYTTEQIDNIGVLEDVHFSKISSAKDIHYYRFHKPYSYGEFQISGPHSSKLTFASFEEEVSKTPYIQREQNLLGKSDGQIERLKKQLEEIRKEIAEIDSYGIKEIFEKTPIDPYVKDFNESNLIRYLLLNGYINENYNDYISVFHAINLSQDDFTYEAKVKNGISLPYDHSLSNANGIIERLQEKYFKREAIWNFSILNQLLANPENNGNKILFFFETLRPGSQKVFDFISGFINNKPGNLNQFIHFLVKYKPNLWSYLISESNITSEKNKEFIKLIFQYGDYSDICAMEENEKLAEYISSIKGFVEFVSSFSESQNILNFVKHKSIKIKALDQPSVVSDKIVDFIIDNDAYEIVPENIKVILVYSKVDFKEEQFNKSNYTWLSEVAPAKLFDYLKSNINDYIQNVAIELSENHYESEDSLIEILNREDLADHLKRILFENQHNKISNLSQVVEKSDKAIALESKAIIVSWDNVNDYFKSTELSVIDQTLENYLENEDVYIPLSKNEIHFKGEAAEEQIGKISEALIYAEYLNFSANTSLLKSVPYEYDFLDYTKISEDKIKWMVSNKFVTLTKENYDAIKTASKGLHIKLATVYETEFINEIASFTLDKDDLILLFKSSDFSHNGKLDVIQKIDDNIIISNPEIAELVCYLLPEDKATPLRYEVFEAMFAANPSLEKKIKTLVANIEKFSDEQLQGFVEKFGEDYARVFVNQNKPVFANKDYNKILFGILKSRNLISSFSENPEKGEIKVVANYQ